MTLADSHPILAAFAAFLDTDGEPIDHVSYAQAFRFLVTLPIELLPTGDPFCTDNDGHVSVDWYETTSILLSGSVWPDGEWSWAYMVGNDHGHGTARSHPEFVEVVRRFHREVAAYRALSSPPPSLPADTLSHL